MRLPVVFFGNTHGSYHFTMLLIAGAVLYKVIRIERRLNRL